MRNLSRIVILVIFTACFFSNAYAVTEFIKVSIINHSGKSIKYIQTSYKSGTNSQKSAIAASFSGTDDQTVLFSPQPSEAAIPDGSSLDVYLTVAIPQQTFLPGLIGIEIADPNQGGCFFNMGVGISHSYISMRTGPIATSSAGHDISCSAEYVSEAEMRFVIYPFTV